MLCTVTCCVLLISRDHSSKKSFERLANFSEKIAKIGCGRITRGFDGALTMTVLGYAIDLQARFERCWRFNGIPVEGEVLRWTEGGRIFASLKHWKGGTFLEVVMGVVVSSSGRAPRVFQLLYTIHYCRYERILSFNLKIEYGRSSRPTGVSSRQPHTHQ